MNGPPPTAPKCTTKLPPAPPPISASRFSGASHTPIKPARIRADPAPMLRDFLDRVVASVFSVDTTLLKLPTRGRQPIAEARQVAMYLAHVALGLSLTDVGRLFERDRTTVAHACKKIEDRRELPEFDKALELLERSIRMVQLTERL